MQHKFHVDRARFPLDHLAMTTIAGMDVEKLTRNLDAFLRSEVEEKGSYKMLHVMVGRKGKLLYNNFCGDGVQEDTIYKIYSMTKCIVSAALCQLYERGMFSLNDPLSKFLPSFKSMKVIVKDPTNTINSYKTESAKNEITCRDILCHTAGFSYAFGFPDEKDLSTNILDHLYKDNDVLRGQGALDLFGRSCTLENFTDELAKLPLLFHPGTRWHYSFATQVVGRLIEVLSGMQLGDYLYTHIFKPLKMVDTGFVVPIEKQHRLAKNYAMISPGKLVDVSKQSNGANDPKSVYSIFQSGGEGLTSTCRDYYRFATCLSQGGILDGARILSPRTVQWMTSNHLPNQSSTVDFAYETTRYKSIASSEVALTKSGFGLGFAISLKGGLGGDMGVSPGSFAWAGAGKTIFWVDPVEEIVAVSMTQALGAPHCRSNLGNIIYGAISATNITSIHRAKY